MQGCNALVSRYLRLTGVQERERSKADGELPMGSLGGVILPNGTELAGADVVLLHPQTHQSLADAQCPRGGRGAPALDARLLGR